jgi:tetratricopeptide (TPR) repeat protein
LQRLDRRFDLLARRDAGAGDRHATLRRAIDASWSLLRPEEQRTLAACSVFRGGFTIASAERVLDFGPDAQSTVLDRLESLRDKSLLVTTPAGAGGPVRLGALQSLAAYAADRLAQRDDREMIHARHAAHYLGESVRANLDWLAAERENLFAAIDWALAHDTENAPTGPLALRALLAFERLAYAQGPFTIWVDALQTATSRDAYPPALRMQGLRALSAARWHVGDLEGALRAADEGLALAPRAGDLECESAIEATRGLTLLSAGHIAASGVALERAAALIRGRGDALRESESLRSLAQWYLLQGRHREALERFAQARAFAAGAPPLEARVMIGMAWVHAARDQLADAIALADEATALHPADEMFESWVGVLRSEIDADREQYDSALERISRSTEAAERRHHRRAVTAARGYRGVLLCQLGRWREARDDLSWAARVSSEPRFRALFVAFLAAIDAIEGHAVRVEERLDDSMRVLSAADDPLRAAAAVLGALCMLLRARTLGDDDAARALASEATAQLLDVATRPVGDAPPARGLYEVRAALRTLERALGPTSLPEAARQAAHGGRISHAGSLRVHREADWFVLPSGERVSLTSRRVLRRLVVALARARVETPGRALDGDALVAAGWPGERILRSAGRNRLKFSIALLRQLGLRDLLRSRSDGYLLDPDVPIAWG